MPFLILAIALGAAPESSDARARFNACVDGSREKGVEACREALAEGTLAPVHRALALTLLAEKLAGLSRWQEAVDADRELVRLRPKDGLAQLRLGESLLYALDEPELSLEPLREASDLRPDDPEPRASLGMAMNALSRFPESVAAFAEVKDAAFFDTHPAAKNALEASAKGEKWPKPGAINPP